MIFAKRVALIAGAVMACAALFGCRDLTPIPPADTGPACVDDSGAPCCVDDAGAPCVSDDGAAAGGDDGGDGGDALSAGD